MKRAISAFSLVEVMMALAIITFSGLTLVGLFAMGLNVSRESSEELEATHITQSIFAARRSAPVANLGTSFALPVLNSPSAIGISDTPLYVTADGEKTTQISEAKFRMIYRIMPQSSPQKTSRVYTRLSWPVQAVAGKPQGSYETYSVFLLP